MSVLNIRFYARQIAGQNAGPKQNSHDLMTSNVKDYTEQPQMSNHHNFRPMNVIFGTRLRKVFGIFVLTTTTTCHTILLTKRIFGMSSLYDIESKHTILKNKQHIFDDFKVIFAYICFMGYCA